MELQNDMRITKNHLAIGLLFIGLFLLQERLLYQIDTSLVMLISITGLIILLLKPQKFFLQKYIFGWMIFVLMLIELYGIILAYFHYRQNPIIGLIGTHYIFIYAFYFVFVDYLGKGNSYKNLEVLKNIIIKLGLLLAVLLILQSFIYPVEIFKLAYGYRNGLRIQGCHFMQYAFVVATCDLINCFTRKKIVSVIIMGYYLIVLNQSRNVILVSFIVFLFIFYRKMYERNKKWFVIGVLILPIILIVSWNYGIGSILGEVLREAQNIKGNVGMRVKELKYYYDLLKDSHYLGIGILGDRFSLRNSIYGTAQGFYLEDIGISAFVLKTGVIGLLWFIAYERKLINTIKKTDSWIKYLTIFLALKTILSFFFSVSFIFDIRDGLIYFVIILSIIDVNASKKGYGESSENTVARTI